MIRSPACSPWFVAFAGGAAGILLATAIAPPRQVAATTALSQESFAVCTAPIDGSMEGVFVLDFETGDLTGGVLGSHYQDVFAFVVLCAVLIFRPSGLLGERVADRA